MSRCMSLFLIDSRLSYRFLPLQMPSSTFARPSLKYIFSGTSVRFFSYAWLANFSISRRCSSSLRRRLGSWFQALAFLYSWMSQPHEPHLAALDAAVGFVHRDRAGAQALHLAAHQHDAALQRVEHFVVVAGLAILGDQPLVRVVALRRRLAVCCSWPWFKVLKRRSERREPIRPTWKNSCEPDEKKRAPREVRRSSLTRSERSVRLERA